MIVKSPPNRPEHSLQGGSGPATQTVLINPAKQHYSLLEALKRSGVFMPFPVFVTPFHRDAQVGGMGEALI